VPTPRHLESAEGGPSGDREVKEESNVYVFIRTVMCRTGNGLFSSQGPSLGSETYSLEGGKLRKIDLT